MSAQRFHRLLSCVISWVPALPLQLAVFLIFASFVTYTEAWSAPRSKVESRANQDCAEALAAGVERNSADMTVAKINEDQFNEDQANELIQNLVALKLKADEARANGQGVRNNFQLMFEDQYRAVAEEIANLAERFSQALKAERGGHQQGAELIRTERAARFKKTRRLKGYKISNRTDLTWSEPLSSKLAVKNLSHVAFYSISLGRVLKLKVKSRDSRLGHTADVYSALVVSENRFLTASDDYTAILWEVDSLGKARIVSRLGVTDNQNSEAGHTDSVFSVVVVSQSRFLTMSLDHTAILWEVDSLGEARIVSQLGVADNQNSEAGHTAPVLSAVVVSENRILTTSTDRTSILWEVDGLGQARIVSRLGVAGNNMNPELGHTSIVVSAEHQLVDGDLVIWTRDDRGRELIWEPEYASDGGEL